jgi:hypothetical protein
MSTRGVPEKVKKKKIMMMMKNDKTCIAIIGKAERERERA